ncbi:CYTH and CHAD domain-containing protein [Kineococcus rhizosphaerae]|uniref:CHAD domain-containing protein n=1 Tax=Kineococcus rhizosphaerae TaxID=559628 RepID=A0A2T0R335_9ACTN|nr:CYTH and CHAD domain-containing protein [Kineococcus rhizosphaerae]PRY14456.1 CHAD domain-containing protein [Kineococcus rhizosphaerae]
MVSEHEEVEIKYDVPPGADLPPLAPVLAQLPDATARGYREGDLGEHQLEATYFDTADLRLQAARTTLRRRTGGPDAGWHLKTPGGEGARLEQRLPLGRAVRTVPAALRRLVAELTGDEPLVPVAHVSTRRHVRTVLDATGTRLAELADDHVEARRLRPGPGSSTGPGDAAGATQSWREAELELLDGDRELLHALDAGLRAAGLQHAASASKVGRILTGTGPAPETPAPPVAESAGTRTLARTGPRRTDLSRKSAAADVLLVHLSEQVQQILDQDPRVRADEPDSIHKMRVATRRLRSALRTFQPLLADPTKPVRDELRWLAAELGTARDAEVLRDRLVRSVASLDADPDQQPADPAATGAVPQLVHLQLEGDYRRAHDQVLAELDSERYQALLDWLQHLVEHPAVTARGRRRADEVLPGRVAKTFKALAQLVEEAEGREPGHERDELLHEARKAAKQVRYAAEAVAVVFGKDAKRFARAVTDVQEVLGEHQDSVVTRQRLQDLAASARPDVAFAYGRLFAQEEAHSAATDADFEQTWATMRTKRLHRWLR